MEQQFGAFYAWYGRDEDGEPLVTVGCMTLFGVMTYQFNFEAWQKFLKESMEISQSMRTPIPRAFQKAFEGER